MHGRESGGARVLGADTGGGDVARVSVQIANLDVKGNGMAGRPNVRNRFLFQWVHPHRQDDNPMESFTHGSAVGPVAPATLTGAVPDGILFKNLEYSQVFGEPLTLQVHHFLDAHRDVLQIALGRLFELLVGGVLGQVSIGPISLARLIGPADSLKLSAETYSLKIGYCQVTLDPSGIPTALPPLVREIGTSALEQVHAFGQLGPAGPPSLITVVSAGQGTSTMSLNFVRS